MSLMQEVIPGQTISVHAGGFMVGHLWPFRIEVSSFLKLFFLNESGLDALQGSHVNARFTMPQRTSLWLDWPYGWRGTIVWLMMTCLQFGLVRNS